MGIYRRACHCSSQGSQLGMTVGDISFTAAYIMLSGPIKFGYQGGCFQISTSLISLYSITKQSMWCIQQQGFTIKFWWAAKSDECSLHCFGVSRIPLTNESSIAVPYLAPGFLIGHLGLHGGALVPVCGDLGSTLYLNSSPISPRACTLISLHLWTVPSEADAGPSLTSAPTSVVTTTSVLTRVRCTVKAVLNSHVNDG